MFSDAAQTMTITEICNDHYLPEIRTRRKPDTVYGYESSINLHVLPRWGTLMVSEISRRDVQAWVDELVPLRGPSGAEKAYKCLRQIIRWAIDEGLEAIDPTRRVEIIQKPQEPLNTLTQRRLKKLIRGFVGHAFEPTLILQAALGLRPSENYYLHWRHIDWRTGAVTIEGALLQVPGLVYESTTKTRKSTRTLYLPQWGVGPPARHLERARPPEGPHHRRCKAAAGGLCPETPRAEAPPAMGRDAQPPAHVGHAGDQSRSRHRARGRDDGAQQHPDVLPVLHGDHRSDQTARPAQTGALGPRQNVR